MPGDRPQPREWLTVAQMAHELGMTGQPVKNLIRSGQLPATRLESGRGRPYVIERQRFERWVQQQYGVTREWLVANPGLGDGMWDRQTGGHR